MSAALIPWPGTPQGPCAGACQHAACRAQHYLAEQSCSLCGKLLGYEAPFETGGIDGLAHTACVAAADRER